MKNFGNLFFAAVLGSVLTIAAFTLFFDNNKTIKIEHQENVPANQALYTIDDTGEIVPLDFTGTAEKVTQAVVNIKSTVINPTSSGNNNNMPENLREYFGPFFREQQNQPRMGTGSGVIINESGYIVTNNHVIADADDIEVTLVDNRTFKATLVGTDPTTDIALLKIDAKGLPTIGFTDSEQVKVGEWVLAIGNPYNLNSTVTAGIVSAKARSIGILSVPNEESRTNEGIESFIQTDAAVNPGNSGGALVNLNGGLIGINTAIQSPTGSYSGYSFAIPSNIVSKVVQDLMEYGTVQRGWLGVVITNVNDAIAKENDLDVIQGAYIQDIAENSGAGDVGIEKGDVIVNIDGHEMHSNTDVIGYVGTHRPGDVIKVKVNRFGKEKTFDVTLKNREGNTSFVTKETTLLSKLGASFEEVDAKTLKRLGIPYGVRVKSLETGLLKKETSMREGFIITHIGNHEVTSVQDIENILSKTSGGVLIEGRYEEYSKKEYYALGLN